MCSLNIDNLEALDKCLEWWKGRDYEFVCESWISESMQFILSKLWHGLVLDGAVLHTLQTSKGAAVKAVKFIEDFPWDYSKVLGTKKEIWGYRNTVEATKLTQGEKTNSPFPPFLRECLLLRMRNVWLVYKFITVVLVTFISKRNTWISSLL